MSTFDLVKRNDSVMGIFKVEKRIAGSDKWELELELKNLVVNNAKFILRDVMYGDMSQVISKMIFGDMNMDNNDDLVNVPPPSPSAENLVNKLYEKPVSKSKSTYSTSPSIEFVATLEESEMNGSGSQIITEFGLVNADDSMFSIKTRAAVIKDANISLKFTWSLVFS